MYTIGEFSKINRITAKTLRHYDQIGLLKPAKVDTWTGYRYYTANQLADIRLILDLKDLGFNLAPIARMLEKPESIPGELEQREREIRQEIKEEEERLCRLDAFGRILKGDIMNQEVTIQSLPEVTVISMRTRVPGYDTYFDIVPKMGDFMREQGLICREPDYCFTIYHDGEYKETDIDVEICEAVVQAGQDTETYRFKTIAGVAEAAVLAHKGPYATLRDSYNRLYQWINDQGFVPSEPPREKYIDGIWNRENPADWLTDIQVPIKRSF